MVVKIILTLIILKRRKNIYLQFGQSLWNMKNYFKEEFIIHSFYFRRIGIILLLPYDALKC